MSGKNRETLRATLQGYHVSFNSAEQVPQRAIDSGLIDRLGYLDPYLGGATTRVLASASWTQNGDNPLTALAYANYYKFKLISNFTYFLDDPVHGDEFEQRDSRFVVGGPDRQATGIPPRDAGGAAHRCRHAGRSDLAGRPLPH